jgi:hypothetical protein
MILIDKYLLFNNLKPQPFKPKQLTHHAFLRSTGGKN